MIEQRIPMAPYLIDRHNHSHFPHAEVGGKGQNLLRLVQNGLPVPPFVCLTATAYQKGTASVAEEMAALLDRLWSTEPRELPELSTRLQSLVARCHLAPELAAQLRRSLPAAKTFSVRSSGMSEDGGCHSFAGQFLTRLNVAIEHLEEAIKACWVSGFDVGVLAYVKRKGLRDYNNRMAVVIQEMVAAESAGVMFQADPQGDRDKQMIVAGFGLGEGVVADRVETDTYSYHRKTHTWELHVASKTRGLVNDENGGTKMVILAPELGSQPVLSDDQRHQLLALSAKVSTVYAEYQDIEWAFDADGELYLLQSRPITMLPKGPQRVFDNSNIAESYPGVISPMTFSVLQRDYYHCMKDLLRRCGVPGFLREKYEDVLQHLVGYISGRAYYNMSNWYRVLLLAPYFKNRLVQNFEQMIGSDGCLQPTRDDPQIKRSEKWILRAIFPVAFFWNLMRHARLMRCYFKAADRLRHHTESLPYDSLCADDLIGHLHNHVRQFMPLMSIPLLNDFFSMIVMVLTREQFVRKNSEYTVADEALLSRVLGNQNIASKRPVLSLAHLAQQVRNQPDLKNILVEILAQKKPVDIGLQLRERGFAEFAKRWQTHLTEYGHRSPKELILEMDTFRDDPRPLLGLMLQAVEQPAPPKINDDSEAEFYRHLAQVKYPRLLRWLVNKTRQTIVYREATRLDRGRHFELLRQLVRHIGRRLVEEGILRQWRDVFYLTLAELDQLRQGLASDSDWQHKIEARRAQELRWQTLSMPAQITINGLVGVERDTAGGGSSGVFKRAPKVSDELAVGNTLRGSGVSGGLVSAKARVILDPSNAGDIAGKILVSETTDPGWVFLMTLAAGLICERGSLLSHTAIIGRELGIPTIVGVKNATQRIGDGATVTMNGNTGEVKIEHEKSAAV